MISTKENAAAQQPRKSIETEIITILPYGFEPAEISRPKGQVFLMVDNRSGLEEVNLRLDRVTGNRLHDVRVPRDVLDWTELVDMQPGSYLLTEADHPDWECHITITAR